MDELPWAMLRRLALLGIWFLGACATLETGERPNVLPYRCNDLVVIGRVTTLSSDNIPESDFIPNWENRYQLRVHIKRVIRGSEPRSIVPAIGVSHGQIRDDLDFLAVLKPIEAGTYSLETASVWDVRPRPRLVEPCSY